MDGILETIQAHLEQYRQHPDWPRALQKLRTLLDAEQARLHVEQPEYGHCGQPPGRKE